MRIDPPQVTAVGRLMFAPVRSDTSRYVPVRSVRDGRKHRRARLDWLRRRAEHAHAGMAGTARALHVVRATDRGADVIHADGRFDAGDDTAVAVVVRVTARHARLVDARELGAAHLDGALVIRVALV